MSQTLDPWNDAGILAKRLKLPGSRLLIVVGAEAWCTRCRKIRPDFDSLAVGANADEIWLWLDVEEHAQFLGDYLPENLPMILVYHGERLVSSAVLDDVSALRVTSVEPPAHQEKNVLIDPGIRSRLISEDWASE
ncbi:thioredoxin family protein [Massilia scottii]|uniref:thioredoxin family protein n=1 Tax=Massilia scottii TaxID=3057166 RepID=UPI0027966B23|nr:thioredoxin family protein [Massilia sp. CCM 9029]MDQ1834714.1 thioredoxin family protein [Massilia sp. CCM 9029]